MTALNDDDLDGLMRRYFARQMAGLDDATPAPAPPARPAPRRSELTLALSVGVGLAAALTLLPTPAGQNRARPAASTPATSLLQSATADGSRLPGFAPTPSATRPK